MDDENAEVGKETKNNTTAPENNSVADDDNSLLSSSPNNEGGDGGDVKAVEGSSERPENVPEEFWKEGALDTDALLTKFAELNESVGVYVAPESYEHHIPEGLPPELVPADDPLIKAAHEWGKKWKMPQEAMDEAVAMVTTAQHEIIEENRAEQTAKLGNDAAKIIGRVEKFLMGNLSSAEYQIIRRVATTSEGVMALDKIRSMALSEAKINISPSSNVSKGLTDAEARDIMRKDEYWDTNSPSYEALRKQVTDHFQRSKK